MNTVEYFAHLRARNFIFIVNIGLKFVTPPGTSPQMSAGCVGKQLFADTFAISALKGDTLALFSCKAINADLKDSLFIWSYRLL